MDTDNKIVRPWQALSMLAVGIFIIFYGLMALSVNARIVLAVDGVVMCVMPGGLHPLYAHEFLGGYLLGDACDGGRCLHGRSRRSGGTP